MTLACSCIDSNVKRIVLFLIPAIAAIGLGVLLIPRPGAAAPRLAGTILPGHSAPDFRLRAQTGRLVSLSGFRGRPVVITFLESHCRELCPIVAETVDRAARDVRASGGSVNLIAISTAPESDTPSAVAGFLRQHHLRGWRYLTSSRTVLSGVWAAYHLYVAPASAGPALRDAHTSATYMLDSAGHERVLFVGTPDARLLDRDLRILAGLPPAPGHVFADSLPHAGLLAPNITVQTLDGRHVTLRSLRGHTVLLNFWATWCVPCRHEVPFLAATARRYRARGLVVLGIDKSEGEGDVRAFLRAAGAHYPVAVDSDGSLLARYAVESLPASYLVDRGGVVRAIQIGVINRAWLGREVDPLLSR